MKKVSYIIVGQGIAGTVLANTFLEQGHKILVVNQTLQNTASRVAAGICNPITGRKWVKTWQADLLFPFLQSFYLKLEKKLNTKFLYPLKVYRLFHSIAEQNLWAERISTSIWQSYMEVQSNDEEYTAWVKNNDLGGWETKQAYHLNLPHLLDTFQVFLQEKEMYLETQFETSELVFKDDKVIWQGYEAQKVIFCEGAKSAQNPFFRWLPFALVKGEILELNFERKDLKNIINQNMFLMPTSYGTFKVGATYNHQNLDTNITEEAKNTLLNKLHKFCPLSFEVIGHKAGIRPATKDRRPFIGVLPKNDKVAIFGGMGTKGLSLSPYYAQQFVEHLTQKKSLDSTVNIERFLNKS